MNARLGNGSTTEYSARLVLAWSLRNHSRRRRYYPSRSHGKHDPKHEVSKYARPGKEYGQQPHDPYDRGIKVKIVGQAGAHARNLFVGARAHQFPLAARLRREAWRRSFRLFGAAVVAKPRTYCDVFSPVYPSHWVTPTGQPYFPPLSYLPKSTQNSFPPKYP